ncbi:GNAT family N-acetyltransferase [Tessaracoccus antarcticus]|uniref:GNAT family N-acetyltransferase n=1 Tax=Tessaracoccus antarcticus TaxID=2479848 RepID=A0A3M0G084_9ACTN|nr:GNAT family N-acetyltransferase [Tessaracoccus antarcticus]RMB58360.1 GNAT family N-acetyltransferase [Tessaracoccus antarcticus]
MSDVSVAGLTDLPALMSLESSFPASQRWSADSWREELIAVNRRVLVCGGEGVVEAAATFALCDDVVDLHRIVTSPAARRRGLARQLLAAGIGWAEAQGACRMLLEVEATNAAALALYATQGFLPIAERRDYYGPGAHAAILERSMSEGEQP